MTAKRFDNNCNAGCVIYVSGAFWKGRIITGKKDITEKTLEDYNDVFADIVNVLLFDGEQIVKEDELIPATPVSQYKIDDTVHEQERDVSKYWNHFSITVAMIGIENQTDSDSDMIFRVIGYDGAAYRSQLSKGKSRYPVITLVLYFGYESHWNQRSLYDRLEIPENLKEYVSDYRMNVFEIAYLDDESVSKFQSDFGIVARFFVQLQKNGRYEPTPEEIRHVDEVLKLMNVLTGDRRFQDAQATGRLAKKGGSTTMIDVLSEVEERGEARGIALGEARGRVQGEAKAYRKMGLSDEEIAKQMQKPIAEIRELLNEKEMVVAK